MLSIDRKNLFDEINKVSYNWIPFENVYYNRTELAEYSFHPKESSSILKIDINGFLVATASNGGPFAMLLNNKIIPSGASAFKDRINVFSAYGDKISTIKFKEVFKEAYDKEIKHWSLFAFTKEEDILLISTNGIVMILDPMSGEVLHRHDYQSQFTGPKNMIDTAKAKENSVVLKTGNNCFYYIHDIYHPEIVEFGVPDLMPGYHVPVEELKYSGTAKKTDLPQRTAIDDYIIIPKSKSRSKKLEILITHPKEGLVLLDDQKNSIYSSDMSQFCGDDVGRIGQISNLALSANESLLAFYSTTSSCIYVFKSDLLKMLNKVETGMPRPEKLIWCANNVPMLIYESSITMIGPNKMQNLPLEDEDKIRGITYCCEIDGVRLITSTHIYWFERVQPSVIKALTFISSDPSNQLIDAYREYELKSENTERIFREIGGKLKEAIETVIEAATYQFHIPFQKLLCEVASFGKKKIDAESYSSDLYVQIIRYLSLINKLRYSSKCRRAITYKQLKDITPKVLLPIQLKYRDYFLVMREAKNLNLKQRFINMCYEEWACALLKNSKRDPNHIQNDILDKLSQLEAEIRAKGGSEKYNALTGSVSTIDYTKIAKVAQEVGKKEIAIQLVNYENSVIKKIPYLLSLNQFEVALEISIANGDMNIVHKVISKILEKHGNDNAWLKNFLEKMKISHRKFIIYAKQEENIELLKKLRDLMEEIYNFSEAKMLLKREGEISKFKEEEREAELQNIEETFKRVYKDSFKSGIVKYQKKLIGKQAEFNKTLKIRAFTGQTARQSIIALLKSSKQSEAKSLAKSIKMSEVCYLGIEAQTFAEMGLFDQIENYLKVKKPKLPYHFLAQLCIEKKKMTLAKEFIDRVQDEDIKETLIMKMR